jgi:hypothetical protein
MKTKELKTILGLHSKWIKSEGGGKRADLSRANLSGADLYGADLYRANLSEANLSGANLYGANLSRANLSRANLSEANLYGANLSEANLYGANLYGADLSGANLSGADLDVKNPPLNSHQFISEILYREAVTKNQRSIAGLIRISTDWCWKDFLKNCTTEEIAWAKEILVAKWFEFEKKFKEHQ